MNSKTGYKITQIGEIPEEWQVTPLGKIAREIKLKNDSKDNFIVFAVTKHSGLVPSLHYFKKRVYSQDLSKYKIIKKEQFAYSPIHLNEGSIGLLETENKGLVSPLHVVFEFLPEANPRFFKYLLKSHRFLSIYSHLPQGSVERRGSILFREFAKIHVQLPPLKEQNKIASILSTVDDAIQKTNETIQKTRELKKGLMQQLLTKGIGHTKFKQTEIGEIPEEWEIVRLGEIIAHEKGRKPKTLLDRVEQNTLPYLSAETLRTETLTQWARETGEVMKVNSDDIILIWDGFYCGDSFIGFEGILSSTMIKIEPKKPSLDKRFLFYFLKTCFKELNSKISGMYLKHVNKSVFESLKLPLPPLSEQRKIASILSVIDGKIEKEKERKEQLEKLKKGLMQDLLTGRVRVKAD